MELGQRQRRQAAEQAPRQLILFPSPFQGHITPMLQLATLLSSRGFSITVVHPRLNSPDHSAYPTLRFEPIDDGLSAEQDVDFMQLTTALNKNCEAPFRECVARLLSEDSSSLIVGLIDDGMPFVEAVSKDFKLPRILFIINSVAAVAGYLTFPFLGERGYFPIQVQRRLKMESEQRPRRQLILFPSPFQGHITPMLQLATLLFSRGFSITVAHPRLNSPDPSAYPALRFEPISDGLSSEQASDVDFMPLTTALNENCETPLRECIARLLSEDSSSSIVGFVDDGLMQFVEAVCQDFKLPRILFIINSAAALAAYLSFPLLGERGYFPIQDLKSEAPIPEVPPLRIKDLPIIGADDPEVWFQYVSSAVKRLMTLSSAIFWNSFESLEQASLVKFKQSFQKPVFAIGPLHKYPTSSSSSLLVQDRSCMAWLDQQPPNSVIYVSFGSLATIEKADLDEAAWGLANSKQPFLWAVRRGAIRGSDMVDLPEGFEEEIQGRGVVANWVSQVEVLAHPAVAGFWTHCGWNSTLESICEGVPMLCWPSFGDQKVNARYISHVWKVGLQLECGPERGDVEKAIRRLMVEKEGEELRERARALKEDAEGCLKEGGSSYQSLKGMVDYIIAL